MVGISIYDDKEMDINSLEFKEIVFNSLKEYFNKNWDNCVSIEKSIDYNVPIIRFYIEL